MARHPHRRTLPLQARLDPDDRTPRARVGGQGSTAREIRPASTSAPFARTQAVSRSTQRRAQAIRGSGRSRVRASDRATPAEGSDAADTAARSAARTPPSTCEVSAAPGCVMTISIVAKAAAVESFLGPTMRLLRTCRPLPTLPSVSWMGNSESMSFAGCSVSWTLTNINGLPIRRLHATPRNRCTCHNIARHIDDDLVDLVLIGAAVTHPIHWVCVAPVSAAPKLE